MVQRSSLLALLGASLVSASAVPQHQRRADTKCPVVFDGRIPTSLELSGFDSGSTSPFNPDYVKGEGLKWSSIIKFPEGDAAAASRFDGDAHKPFEVTIGDDSIFQTQKGFRRAGLQFKGDTNNGSPATKGLKTIHFSIKVDPQRQLNLSHEYIVSHFCLKCGRKGKNLAD